MPVQLARSAASLAAELARVRDDARALVNGTVGDMRARFITVMVGQEMIYREKKAEAESYTATAPVYPLSLDDYPFIAAEVGVTAPTAKDVAELWLAQAALWKTIGAQLETLRLSAIAAIAAAPTVAAVDAALSSFEASAAAWTPPGG